MNQIKISDLPTLSAQLQAADYIPLVHSGGTYKYSLFDYLVKNSGSETIDGVKTFSDSPVVPTPTTDMQASTKEYADGAASSAVAALKVGQANGVATLGSDSKLSSSQMPTIPNVTTTTNGLMLATDKVKLDGLAPGSVDLGSVLTFEAGILGVPYDSTDMYMHSKFSKAFGTEIGASISLGYRKTPVTWAEAQSTANPSYPEYFPAIPRFDGDHDITSAMAPLLVSELASKYITVGSTSSFSGTLASGVVTLPATTDGDHLLIALVNAALVLRWRATNQSATYASLGGLYTGTGQYCLRTGNVNYGITLVDAVARTIAIANPPANGSITFTIPQYGVPGTDTSIRLRNLSGFTPVVCGDYDGEILEGLAKMDRFQKHKAQLQNVWPVGAGGGVGSFVSGSLGVVDVPLVADGQGTPRMGKTTDPRGYGVALYTWARTLLARNW